MGEVLRGSVSTEVMRKAADEHWQELLDLPNVHGIGVGETGVCLFVNQKLPLDELAPAERIPSVLKIEVGDQIVNVPTDVIVRPALVIGELTDGLPTGWVDRQRPVRPGFSAQSENMAKDRGTLGAIIVKNGKLCLLSCAHVFVKDPFTAGAADNIIQPSSGDKGASPRDRIGTVVDYTVFKTTGVNTVDAAIASLGPSIKASDEFPHYGKLKGHYTEVRQNWRLKLVGATTKYVEAHVQRLDVREKITYMVGGKPKSAVFHGLVEMNHINLPGYPDVPAGQPGDSGALWVSEDSYACLLHVASHPQGDFGYGILIDRVLKRFGNAKLWGGRGLADGEEPIELPGVDPAEVGR